MYNKSQRILISVLRKGILSVHAFGSVNLVKCFHCMMNGRRFVWICSAIFTCFIFGQYISWIYFTKFDNTSEIDFALLHVKQSLLNNGDSRKLDPFVQRRPKGWITKNYAYNNVLTTAEEKRANICQVTAKANRYFDLLSFFKNSNVCVHHHSYLKRNGSIIIEIGGNIGHDVALFANNYNARHIILEPVQQYADILKKRFANNSRITVLNFGLGKKTTTVIVQVRGEETNVFTKRGNTSVTLISSIDFFTSIGVGSFDIDLLTMDCEGCELDVLESLLENNMIKYFKNVQFESHIHLVGLKRRDWIKRYCVLQEYLSRSHYLSFQYKHVWENWRRQDLKQ